MNTITTQTVSRKDAKAQSSYYNEIFALRLCVFARNYEGIKILTDN